MKSLCEIKCYSTCHCARVSFHCWSNARARGLTSWPTLIVLAHSCLLVIVKNNQGNDRHFRASPDGVALWALQSIPYQPYHDLRTHRSGHRASRDLMGWDVWWHQLHRPFHRAGPCLSRFHQLHRPCLHHLHSLPLKLPCVIRTQLCSLSQPIPISPSQPRSTGTTPHRSPSNSGPIEATRVYGFDWNENWQADREQYDNQKVNGLTFPRVIRSSALTQKLDIEGCDPLALPVAAMLYQQANNHWLRKLAHGRDLYLIPTGEIAAVVFCDGAALSAEAEESRDRPWPPWPRLSGQGSTRWQDCGQNFEHQICGTAPCRTHSGMASNPIHRSWLTAWDHQSSQSVGWARPAAGRRSYRSIHSSSHRPTELFITVRTNPTCSVGAWCTFTTSFVRSRLPSYHSTHVQHLAHWQRAYGPGRSDICQVAQRTSTLWSSTKRPHSEHRQGGYLVGQPTGWSCWNDPEGRSNDGHSGHSSSEEL